MKYAPLSGLESTLWRLDPEIPQDEHTQLRNTRPALTIVQISKIELYTLTLCPFPFYTCKEDHSFSFNRVIKILQLYFVMI